ncbi:molybdenum cofactor biosynthesis protein MoaD [Kiloniella litopenaei]|uniref:Molybdopterin synthase sulfur carrier subunit n=1 Tax=Kiloniella litopenaei TaxID=1549748 RepID=A0A0M2R7S2_9PROT|nr:molybdopterin converting factor subunit 1 [Kiloniella litopenaei]KKJ77696.1 molybdenum cofactor biosynthesis protein MoaD [Kiloniella litopenaei]
MKILYFAWLRTTIGKSSEDISPPEAVHTVSDLLNWLPSLGENYSSALEKRDLLRIAINQEYADLDQKIKPGDEIAIFPPVTGG